MFLKALTGCKTKKEGAEAVYHKKGDIFETDDAQAKLLIDGKVAVPSKATAEKQAEQKGPELPKDPNPPDVEADEPQQEQEIEAVEPQPKKKKK